MRAAHGAAWGLLLVAWGLGLAAAAPVGGQGARLGGGGWDRPDSSSSSFGNGSEAGQQPGSSVACRAAGGQPVDWWVLLKHPHGWAASLALPGAPGWQHGVDLRGEANPLAATLAALDAPARPGLAWAVWNDADPAGKEWWASAHAKGLAVAALAPPARRGRAGSSGGAWSGVWLVHSAPRFPGVPGAAPGWRALRPAQAVFGQHFACFSLASRAALRAVARLQLSAAPHVYASALPRQLGEQLPEWRALLGGAWANASAAASARLATAGGAALAAFAKPAGLNASLSDAVVGPSLAAGSLAWETWRHGGGPLPSACPRPRRGAPPPALNVDRIAFPGPANISWPWQADHSKWGVSLAGSSLAGSSSSSGSSSSGNAAPPQAGGVVCLGDHNRAASQAARGGSCVCLRHPGLWAAFRSIVAAVEPCGLLARAQP